jgi:hypothetical protein
LRRVLGQGPPCLCDSPVCVRFMFLACSRGHFQFVTMHQYKQHICILQTFNNCQTCCLNVALSIATLSVCRVTSTTALPNYFLGKEETGITFMSSIRQIIPLGRQGPWRTRDPYLFCVHHNDHYPAGNSELAPSKELLRGRSIGSDFSGRDGWSMYHGSNVPGFPSHPHRGFETITFVRSGFIDHSDSLGAAARCCSALHLRVLDTTFPRWSSVPQPIHGQQDMAQGWFSNDLLRLLVVIKSS